MKKRELSNIRAKMPAEIRSEIGVALQKLKALQFNLALGKVKNQKELREVKRTIAQINTLLREKAEGVRS